MDYGGVCCVFGYNTLLQDEKELMKYMPYSPRGSNLFLNLCMISPCIASDEEMELVQQCKLIIIDLLQTKML